MWRGFRYIHFTVLILSIVWTSVALPAPSDESAYTLQRGGLVDLADGSYVQGSLSYGGIQPDYRIDLSDPDLAGFLEKVKSSIKKSLKLRLVRMIGRTDLEPTKTIELVTALVQKALPEGDYYAFHYRRVLEEHRLQNIDISLGEYLRCKAGVCRENALLTHFALKAAGIENQLVYAFVRNESDTEDHAFVVITDKDGRWIVDPYNIAFHGKNFDDLMQPQTRRSKLRRARFAPRSDEFNVRIMQVNDYPTYWLPKRNATLECSRLFLSR